MKPPLIPQAQNNPPKDNVCAHDDLRRTWTDVVVENREPNTANAPERNKKHSIQNMLKAVHGDLIDKQRRAKNVIVSGMKPSDSISDSELFQQLCFNYLGINIDATFSRRLGTVKPGRIRPLLVAFSSEETAQAVLIVAKHLRQSNDEYVKNNVYINKDLTKAEAAAEYEIRKKNRQKLIDKQSRTQVSKGCVEKPADENVNSIGGESSSDDTSRKVLLPDIHGMDAMSSETMDGQK